MSRIKRARLGVQVLSTPLWVVFGSDCGSLNNVVTKVVIVVVIVAWEKQSMNDQERGVSKC
jgi:hypothetical protein